MKIPTIILYTVVLISCKDASKKSKTEVTTPKGTFSGNLMGKKYEVEIQYSYFNQDYFKFQSDKTDITDSYGDGLIISGYQQGKKMVLTINDNGKNFSSANIQFTKADNIASGSGKLFEEGGDVTGLEVSFKIECQ